MNILGLQKTTDMCFAFCDGFTIPQNEKLKICPVKFWGVYGKVLQPLEKPVKYGRNFVKFGVCQKDRCDMIEMI